VNTQSDFGMEFDSLADVVSFGVAPGILLYISYFNQLGGLGI
jgi:CDP-diacylglycerol--serine O-phosphatidyltransferase